MVLSMAKVLHAPVDSALMSHDDDRKTAPIRLAHPTAGPSDDNDVNKTTVSIAVEREERLRKDRLRKRLSKEKFQKELNELHRTAVALEYQLATVQKRKRVNHTSEHQWYQHAASEKTRLDEAIAVRHELYQELVNQVEKAIIYRSICGPSSESMMLLDPRRDPWTLHTLSRNPLDQGHALRGLAMYQSSKITPELFAKLPGPRHGCFNYVLDETDQYVSYVELFKHGTFAAHHEDVARALHRYCLTAHRAKQVTNVDDTLALTVFTEKGRHYVVNIMRESADRTILTHRTLVFDDVHGRMASESIAGWWVFERLPSLDGTTPRSVMRCYAQACIDVQKELLVQAYASYLVASQKEDEDMNQVLSQFRVLSLS
ncbi:hypothetical protein ACHHYP_08296 [Achlya hypogyna]|uniref:Uncharacterized protein n=1 Tax=Achlya hypogyna TaxID=1202772 RepID=A0A1V9ZKV1_ACHHY|nr:hypothetical protein ACHHYP_08296 [Achlya hypogyna]